MDALTKAMNRSSSVVTSAREYASKQASVFGSVASVPMGMESNAFGVDRNHRHKYRMFHGWLYSAINALACEGASQPVNVAKLKIEETGNERRFAPRTKNAKPHHIYKKMTDDIASKAMRRDIEILGDSPVLDALERPNSIQSRWQFVYNFIANLNLTGWSYVIFDVNEEGVVEFYSLPTTWVTPMRGKDGAPFAHFMIKNPNMPGDKGETLDRENVAFAYMPNPGDPLSALAPVSTQIQAIRIDGHMQTSQERFFENGIFPSVIITIGKNPHPEVAGGVRPRLTGAQRRQVTGAIRRTVGGVANYGNPAIVDGLIEKIDRLSATQNEMGWDKSEDKVRTRILSAFGVHPYILGEPVNLGGYAQAAKIEERFCKRVNVFLDMLSNMMTNKMSSEQNDDKLLVWWDKCEPHDPSQRNKLLIEARKNGDITRNEIRSELGYPPADEELAERSKLLDTVGGMNVAVNILTSVGGGQMAPDSAAQLLSLFFSIPIETATAIIGKTNEQQTIESTLLSLQAAVEDIRSDKLLEYTG